MTCLHVPCDVGSYTGPIEAIADSGGRCEGSAVANVVVTGSHDVQTSGSGNDFLVCSLRVASPELSADKEIVRGEAGERFVLCIAHVGEALQGLEPRLDNIQLEIDVGIRSGARYVGVGKGRSLGW